MMHKKDNYNKTVLLVGGAGYVGIPLAQKLLSLNYAVIIYDLFLFNLNKPGMDLNHKNLTQIQGDVRDYERIARVIRDSDYVIHLACISNDPSYDLNPDLSKDINYHSFKMFLNILDKSFVERFIYASSSSVYGVSKDNNVTELSQLDPLTSYSYYKMKCEEEILKKNLNTTATIVRPATVSGYSNRQRLDLVVNILTTQAFFNQKINIHGGEQLRPNIHISDLIDFYCYLLTVDSNIIHNQIFNYGENNYSVRQIAQLVQDLLTQSVELVTCDVIDQRSYHISSQKAYDLLDIRPKMTLKDSILDLINAFNSHLIPDATTDPKYHNINVILECEQQLLTGSSLA